MALISSCATSPTQPESFAPMEQTGGAGVFAFLPPGAAAYLWADVKESRPLLDALSFAGFNAKDAAQVLDRTDTAAAAFFRGPPPVLLRLPGQLPKLKGRHFHDLQQRLDQG